MRDLGASESDIDARRAGFEQELAERAAEAVYEGGAWRTSAGELLEIEVYPDNRSAWQVFLALSTQWEQPGSFGGRCTVPFADVEVAMRMMVPESERPDCFDRVRVLLTVARHHRIEEIDRNRSRT